jgi:CheY-like chemotaxis protein
MHEPSQPNDSVPRARILLVEDHELTSAILVMLLNLAGHEVRAAGSVRTALETASCEHFDLVISDLTLPDGTGLELMPQLKQLYGLPGIMLSGYGSDEDVRNSLAAGFEAHLLKPVEAEQLARLIDHVLAERSSR